MAPPAPPASKSGTLAVGADTYVGIQALRFYAALIVVVAHATSMMQDRHLSAGFPRWTSGHAGVDIFFVISGFVMFLTSRALLERNDGWRIFLSRRLIRVVPLYWIAITTKLLLILGASPWMSIRSGVSAEHVMGSYLFLPALFPAGVDVPLLPVGWTLNYEIFFYVLCTLALLSGVRPLRFASVVLIPLALVGLVYTPSAPIETTYINPIILEFLMGMLVAKGVTSRIRVPTAVASLLIACGIATLLIVREPGPQWRMLLWGVPAAATVLGVALMERTWRLILGRRVLLLGDSSYALYLAHTFVLPVLGIALAAISRLAPWTALVVSVAGSVWLSTVVHTRIERPLTAWLKEQGFAGNRRATSA
jgi:exopolysaccharide production protein ExoZ